MEGSVEEAVAARVPLTDALAVDALPRYGFTGGPVQPTSTSCWRTGAADLRQHHEATWIHNHVRRQHGSCARAMATNSVSISTSAAGHGASSRSPAC